MSVSRVSLTPPRDSHSISCGEGPEPLQIQSVPPLTPAQWGCAILSVLGLLMLLRIWARPIDRSVRA